MRRAARAVFLAALAASAAFAADLRISKHARARMVERGVSEEQVRRILETERPFRYGHQRRLKTGYYDADSRIFLATDRDVLITVITNATPRYVENLKRKKP